VSKCKLWSLLEIYLGIEIFQVCILVIDALSILGALVGFQDFAVHFLDGALSQDVTHIDDPPFLKDTHVALDILSSCVGVNFLISHGHYPFFFLLVSFSKFRQESYVGVCGHFGFRIVGGL
jgi:hypothetical protein